MLSSTAALISRQVCSFLVLITLLNPPTLTPRHGYLGARGWLVGLSGQHCNRQRNRKGNKGIYIPAGPSRNVESLLSPHLSSFGEVNVPAGVCFLLHQLEEVLCLGASPPPFHYPLALGTLLVWLCDLYPVATRYCDTPPAAFAGRLPGAQHHHRVEVAYSSRTQ